MVPGVKMVPYAVLLITPTTTSTACCYNVKARYFSTSSIAKHIYWESNCKSRTSSWWSPSNGAEMNKYAGQYALVSN